MPLTSCNMQPIPTIDIHVNRFEEIPVPSKREVFARLGERARLGPKAYTNDETAEYAKTKIQQIADFEKKYGDADEKPE